jgi:hypothetical protein
MIGMTLLSFAVEIGELFEELEYKNLIGLIVAITGSQLMDWGLDSTETPAKAYTLDCIQDLEDQVSSKYDKNIKILLWKGFCLEHPNIIHRCWRRNRLSMRWCFRNGRQSEIILCRFGILLRLSLLDNDFVQRTAIPPEEDASENSTDRKQFRPNGSNGTRQSNLSSEILR